ncbi:MAG TPA: hypothetical protein VMI54_19240 [Polyangiaceae bacterium]|nr:hypothetical protein [Polyangiaceae bacterium]
MAQTETRVPTASTETRVPTASTETRLPQAVAEDVWFVDGPIVKFYGMPFTTRMAIVRLSGRKLWLWSPIALDAALRDAVARLGEPCFAVEPNKLHHLALAEWVAAWPELRLYAPPGLAEKRRDLKFAAELTNVAPPEWGGEFECVVVEGSKAVTEVVFFHRPSSTCFVGDLIQRHDPAKLAPWPRFVARFGGVLAPTGGTPLDWRLSFLQRERARRSVAAVAAWEPRTLVIAHGAPALVDGAGVLRRALQWLLPPAAVR